LGLALLLLVLGSICLGRVSYAQGTYMGVNLATGLYNQPEEKDLQKTSQTFDLSFDLAQFRMGYNKAQSYMNASIYEKTWDIKVTAETYYGAWVIGVPEGTHFYGLLGLGYQINQLSLGNQVPDRTTQDLAWLMGGGLLFDLDSLFLGVQWMYLSGRSTFNDITVATGSNQVQLALSIPF